MPRKRPMLTGPNGERRPTSPAAAAVSVVEEMARKHGHVPDGGQPASTEKQVSPSPREAVADADRLSA